MVSTSPDTLMSSTLMSIREPLIATTSYELGIIVKSIDVSLFTVEVNLMASIETFLTGIIYSTATLVCEDSNTTLN